MSHDIFPTPYDVLGAAWRAIRATHGLRLREIACVGAPRTLLLVELGDPALPVVSLSAGVHGDEPAAPWALHSLVRDRLLDPRFSYRIWPCLNPTGLRAGTRENAEGTDVNRSFSRGGRSPEAKAVLSSNRDRTFALSIDLHEDFESAGFYLYEPVTPPAPTRYAEVVSAAVREAGFPVEAFLPGFDLGPPGSESMYTLGPGFVIVDGPAETRLFGAALPLGLVLIRRATDAALTFETPRSRPWDERIAAHRVAVVAALQRCVALGFQP